MIETVNGTSWEAIKGRVQATTASILLFQEHRLADQERISEASAWLRGKGWKSLWEPAVKTEGGTSGGVGIACWADLGLDAVGMAGGSRWPAHAVLCRLHIPGWCPLLLGSIYGLVGQGLSEEHMEGLAKVATVMAESRMPFVLGADWNLKPQQLELSGLPSRLSGRVIFQANRSTCISKRSRTTIDYFLVSEDLCGLIDSVSVAGDALTVPHRPVWLRFVERPLEARRKQFKRRVWVPSVLPVGPKRPPLPWDDVLDDLIKAESQLHGSDRNAMIAVNRVYRRLINHTMKEAAGQVDFVDNELPNFAAEPRLVEVPAMPKKKEDASWVSFLRPWRWTSSILTELRALLDVDTAKDSREQWLQELWSLRARLDGDEVPDLCLRVHECMNLLELAKEIADALEAAAVYGAQGESWAKSRDSLDALLEEAEAGVAREDKLRKADAAVRWREWAKLASAGGAGGAHRWTKLQAPWRPHAVNTPGSGWSASPADILTDEARRKALVWECSELGEGRQDIIRQEALPEPTPEEVFAAARTFRAGRARAFDAVHMRHFTMLPKEGLLAWGRFFVLIERIAVWPRAMWCVQMPLLEKPKGGYRGIGILPGAYRLWARVRRPWARAWEQQHRNPRLVACAGISCIDVIWRHATRCEGAVADGLRVLAFGWDMKEYYEHLSRDLLRSRAESLAFPAAILNPALAMYSAPRYLQLGAALEGVGHPSKGVVAGCGFATYVVQAYCSGPIKGFGDRHPRIGLSLYIDDFTGVVTARDDDDAMMVLTEGMVDLRGVIEDELRCCIAVDKSQIAASSKPLLRRATRVLGALGGRAVDSVEALGIDLPAGKSRLGFWRGSLRRKRAAKAKARRGRIKRLRAVCVEGARKVAFAGALPASSYGTEFF